MDGVDATRRVFISYSSKDQAYAEAILKALERRGISCWYAPRDVPGGANYMGTILRAIQTVEAMVVVLSRNANESDDMKKEVALAGRRRILIIAVRIDTTALDDDWTFEFSVRQVFNTSSGLDQIVRSLGDQLQRAIAGGRGPRPAAAPPAASVPPPAKADNVPRKRPGMRQSQLVPMVVVAGIIVTSFTLGMLFFSRTGQEIVQKTATPTPNPVIALPVQKCDGVYVPTYPRKPGTC